jgi:ribonuclease D
MTELAAANEVTIAATETALADTLDALEGAEVIALDVEADGLFAFRPKLCTLQIAWERAAGRMSAVVVDALAVDVAPLRALFGGSGPLKVLHDLTFDARMLDEVGLPLANVRDTSVAARLLGWSSIGLAALLERELDVHLEKRFQQHDWSRRPLTEEQIRYLADDVRYLIALDLHLCERVSAQGIEAEVADECAYKLASAGKPPRDVRPAYVRIKGALALDAPGRAVLRRLTMARDAIAAGLNVPPFKVVSSEVLLELARSRPATAEALAAVKGAMQGRAGGHVGVWLRAIAEGGRDGDVPAEDAALFEPVRSDREVAARRRALDSRIAAWRKAEAAQRGVSDQAVLPGHCAHDLADVLLEQHEDGDALRAAIAAVPGLGARRLERYLEAFVAFAEPAALPKP